MTRKFINRVWKECIVDTRKYRYVLHTLFTGYVIERCPLDKLDKLPAYGSYWEIVYRFDGRN